MYQHSDRHWVTYVSKTESLLKELVALHMYVYWEEGGKEEMDGKHVKI